MTEAPLRVAALGMGWWSDVLADAIKRSKEFEIVACYTRSADKRRAFAEKYGCRAGRELRGDPEGPLDRGRRQYHAQQRAPGDHAGGGRGRQARVPRQADRQHRARRAEIAEVCKKAGVVLALGYQRRRESHFRWIKARSTRAVSASWCRPNATSAATGSASST